MLEEPGGQQERDAEFDDLLGAAMSMGLDQAQASDGFAPFMMYTENGTLTGLQMFCGSDIENYEPSFRRRIAELGENVTSCAMVSRGFVKIGEARFDAILVEISLRGKPVSAILAQRYDSNHASGKMLPLGDVMVVHRGETWL